MALKKLRTSGLKGPAKLFSILTTGLRGKDLMFLKGNWSYPLTVNSAISPDSHNFRQNKSVLAIFVTISANKI